MLLLQGITLLQDAGTSDDSGRASERLTGSSVAPRDPDSSRDRLSDVRISNKLLMRFQNKFVHRQIQALSMFYVYNYRA